MPAEEQYYTQARVANKYDVYIGKNIPFYWSALNFIADYAGEHFKGRQNLEVYDIGCGTANHCVTVSPKIHIKRLTLVDHSSAILEVALQKVRAAESIPADVRIKHASFLSTDWLANIKPGSVDLILSSLTLDHIVEDSDFLALLGRMRGILSDNGCFVLCEKCSSPDHSTGSWQSVAQMIHIRGENNRRHQFKNEEEIAEWKKHNFEEDIMRPLSLLWSLAEQAGFEVRRAGGAVLPNAAELDYERFYALDEITPLDRASVFNHDVGYGAGILICVKKAQGEAPGTRGGRMKLLLLPGDGIGTELAATVRSCLHALDARFQLQLELTISEIGLARHEREGSTMPPDLMTHVEAADGVILGPLSTADYPPSERGGINVSAKLRRELDLYANIRPSRARAGIARTDKPMDLVIVRENSEGFFADRCMAVGNGEFMPTPDVALAIRKITVPACRRIAKTAFALARERRKKVTAVHKRNVLKITDGLFLKITREVGSDYPDVEYEEVLVDAMAALLIRRPEQFDVVVTTNLFGDILSDEAGELSGSLGLAPSLNAGEKFAVAQAVHGSAPDIAGLNKANPAGLILSTALLLRWLGRRQSVAALTQPAECVEAAIERLVASPQSRTVDLGGTMGTAEFGQALCRAIATSG